VPRTQHERATVYKWRAKYGGMDANLISEMKAMAEENRRLKRMYANVIMQNDLLNCEGERH
jgi:putative transposase